METIIEDGWQKMGLRYEQVLPGQWEYLSHMAAQDIISRLSRGVLSGIAAISESDEGDSLAGFVGMSKDQDAVLVLEWLYVDRAFRGMGIGRRLLELVNEAAVRSKSAAIRTLVYPGLLERGGLMEEMSAFLCSMWDAASREEKALWMVSKQELLSEDFARKARTRLEELPGELLALRKLDQEEKTDILMELKAAGEIKDETEEDLSFALKTGEGWEGVILTEKYGDIYEPRLFSKGNVRRSLKLMLGLTVGLCEKMREKDRLRIGEDQDVLGQWMDRLFFNSGRQDAAFLEKKLK